jgi:hypothetical protein
MADTWPWLALAGLGAFHGLNPGMGWLFAVALGLHRKSRMALFAALLPLAAGHAASVALVAGLFVGAGLIVGAPALTRAAGGLLLAWALYHALYGHRRRVRYGMTVGLAGLFAWSFLMATAHGAGLMLIPALAPLCLGSAAQGAPSGPMATAFAGVSVHTGAMLLTTALCALAVYQADALGLLRSAWVNLDWIWTAALVVAGLLLIVI